MQRRLLPFVFFALISTVLAQSAPVASKAHSAKNGKSPISGTATFGYGLTFGDFDIYGSGIYLSQTAPWDNASLTWEGCAVGADCTLTFSPSDTAGFCQYCLSNPYWYAWGNAGGKTANYIQPALEFTGTAFYPGGDTLTMRVDLAGQVTGYELINCNDEGKECQLGAAVFTVELEGKGTAEVAMQSYGNPTYSHAWGSSVSFSGKAHVKTSE
jgi:hypothetical protein